MSEDAHETPAPAPLLNFVEICERANELYTRSMRVSTGMNKVTFRIGNNDVKCIAQAIVEAVNKAKVTDKEAVAAELPGVLKFSAWQTAELALQLARAKLQQARELIDRTGDEPRLCVELDNLLFWLEDTALPATARRVSEVRQ